MIDPVSLPGTSTSSCGPCAGLCFIGTELTATPALLPIAFLLAYVLCILCCKYVACRERFTETWRSGAWMFGCLDVDDWEALSTVSSAFVVNGNLIHSSILPSYMRQTRAQSSSRSLQLRCIQNTTRPYLNNSFKSYASVQHRKKNALQDLADNKVVHRGTLKLRPFYQL